MELIFSRVLWAGDSSHSSRRFALQKAMERIAEESGDLALGVSVAMKDLSQPAGYLGLAKLLQRAGRDDEALAWAEKGAHDFAGSWRSGFFAAFLADAYHRRGRDEDAIDIYWKSFLARPSCAEYSALRKQAELAGVWPQWRAKAIEHLNSRITGTDGNVPFDKVVQVKLNGILVEILISEEHYDEAWSQAERYGCPHAEMRALVKIREHDHPTDCIPVCKKLCEKALKPADSRAYSEAADELEHLGEVMARANVKEDFIVYMQSLRTKFKARKNLMIELDRRELP